MYARVQHTPVLLALSLASDWRQPDVNLLIACDRRVMVHVDCLNMAFVLEKSRSQSLLSLRGRHCGIEARFDSSSRQLASKFCCQIAVISGNRLAL